MNNKDKDRAIQAPAEANRDKHINFLAEEDDDDRNEKESIEERRLRHDADAGNDGPTSEMLEKEIRIDPGNEHHHRSDADDKVFDDDIDRSPRNDDDNT